MLTKTRSTHNLSDRLVWAEGTQLTPQHFQYWERYLAWQREAQQWHGFGWGIKKLVIDQHALEHGIFRIKHFELRFESGDFYLYDDHVPVDLQCDLTEQQHFPLHIVLCLPMTDTVQGIPGYPEASVYGANSYFMQRADCYDPSKRRDIQMAEPNWQLCVKEQEPKPSRCLTLAKINLTANKQFEWANDYASPVVWLQSSTVLKNTVALIQHTLECSAKKLYQQATQNIKEGLLKLELNRFQNKVMRCLAQSTHPYDVYCICSDCYSVLASLVDQPYRPIAYQHTQLYETFSQLHTAIHNLLAKPLSQLYQEASFQPQLHGFWRVHVADKQYWLQPLYLIFTSSSSTIRLEEQGLHQIKVATPSVCQQRVASALSGMELQVIDRHALPMHVEPKSFVLLIKLNPEEREKICEEQGLSAFIPQYWQVNRLSLLSLQESV